MNTAPCPHHQVDDLCHYLVQLVEELALIGPRRPVDAPPPSPDQFPGAPRREAVLARLLHRINEWGAVAVEPDMGRVDPDATDHTAVEFAVLALADASGQQASMSPLSGWRTVTRHLRTAAQTLDTARRAETEQETELGWYIAALWVDAAFAYWKSHVGTYAE
ncbi:hypothetical protein [Streptomyces roseolus]|uniref:hypothetical protein n=1 Tax=Streptomyces roseolus TaxID=67358 RepID=UPI0037AF27A4